MIKLSKITVMTLRDTLNAYPNSVISNDELLLENSIGSVNKTAFGKTYLVDIRKDSCLIIGEYLTNKFEYKTRMEYVPTVICKIHKEWELQE